MTLRHDKDLGEGISQRDEWAEGLCCWCYSTRAEIQTSAEEEGHRVLESLRSVEVHRFEIQTSTYKSSLNGIRIFTEGDNEARSTEAGKTATDWASATNEEVFSPQDKENWLGWCSQEQQANKTLRGGSFSLALGVRTCYCTNVACRAQCQKVQCRRMKQRQSLTGGTANGISFLRSNIKCF